MNKIISIEKAGKLITNGMSVMLGGFLGVGSAKEIIDEIIKLGLKDLTIIGNDTSFPDKNIGKLITNKMVKKAIVSHIGTNPETGRQMNSGELEVILTPQGTLAEIIRAGGAGLGGILTPTGLGTIVEDGKEIIEIDKKKFILEKSLKADAALIYATKADKHGNLVYEGSTRNFNPVMATAADIVIAEVEEILEELNPNEIVVPGIFVDYIVKKEGL